MAAQMREMGAPEQLIEQHLGRFKPDDNFEVFEENWLIVSWFVEVAEMIVWVGAYPRIDVTAIKHDAEMLGRKIKPNDYQGLKIIFSEFCYALHQKRNKR